MFISWKHFLDFMGKALEVVNQYYRLFEQQEFDCSKGTARRKHVLYWPTCAAVWPK
jgi:hypothetical protein